MASHWPCRSYYTRQHAREKATSNLTIGGTVLNKDRLKRTAVTVVKHVHNNAAQYVTLIGDLTQEDYPVALTSLIVLILRTVTGAIQRKINHRKKEDDDTRS